MDISIEQDKSRVQALRDIVACIKGDISVYYFNNSCEKIGKNNIPNPKGYTYMANAFRKIKADGYKEVILITDGEATDKEEAVIEAKDLKIEIIYVGGVNKPKFLDDLAGQSGSTATVQDLKKPKELAKKIQLLLESG